jgi:hypothetical protein
MHKLKLEIDALRVESFDTSAAAMGAGTVRAHADAVGVGEDVVAITTPQTQQASCFDTCKISCLGTCLVSCAGSCIASCDGNCTDLCSLGCSDGCTVRTCLSGAPVCCA